MFEANAVLQQYGFRNVRVFSVYGQSDDTEPVFRIMDHGGGQPSVQIDAPLFLSEPLPVLQGGTGAITAADARANLEITPANIGAKPTQTAVADPTASGTAVAFIDSVTQNADGVITPTKKTVRTASQSESGLMSATDKAKLDGIAAGAQVNSLTGVKGNAESSYRTGNVNLTPANIGAVQLIVDSDSKTSYSFDMAFPGGPIKIGLLTYCSSGLGTANGAALYLISIARSGEIAVHPLSLGSYAVTITAFSRVNDTVTMTFSNTVWGGIRILWLGNGF